MTKNYTSLYVEIGEEAKEKYPNPESLKTVHEYLKKHSSSCFSSVGGVPIQASDGKFEVTIEKKEDVAWVKMSLERKFQLTVIEK